MTSKTFEPKTFDTAHHDNKILKVDVLFDNPRLLIKEFDGDARGFAFESSDAPALALAILEAAGFKAEFHATGTFQDGDCWQLENVAQVIKDYLSIKDAEAAEAKAQAKLETEARDFYDTYHSAAEWPYQDWVMLEERYKAQFLAVARKAREMAKEATK